MVKICRACSKIVQCHEVPGRPGFFRCPYGHGPWAEDDPGWP